jgi:hypothetical protein
MKSVQYNDLFSYNCNYPIANRFYGNLPEDFYNNLHAAIVKIDERDLDRARYRNFIGWDRKDSVYFKDILRRWKHVTDNGKLEAHRRLWHYRKQLKDCGIEYNHIMPVECPGLV